MPKPGTAGAAAREILPQLKALQAAWKAGDKRSAVAEDVISAIEAAN